MSELRELFPDLPPMSDEMRLDMHRKYAKPYIFYKKHKTYVDCYCTHCMQRYQLRLDAAPITPRDNMLLNMARTIRTNGLYYCPECGIKAMAKADGISRKNLCETKFLCCFHVLENKVFAVCGELVCGYGQMPVSAMGISYSGSKWYEIYAVEYAPGTSRMVQYSHYFSYKLNENMYEPYIQGSFGNQYFSEYNPEVLQNSFMKYILPADYSKDGLYKGFKPLLYMMYAVRYPAVEMLLKSGFGEVVEDIIDRGRNYKSVIDLNGRTAAEVFKTDPNDAAVIRQAARDGAYVNMNTLQCYRRLKSIAKKQKRKYKFSDAVNIINALGSHYNDACSMLRKTALTPEKLINYRDKQRKRDSTFQDYIDYIKECETLGYDLTLDEIRRPSDLRAAHERTSSAVRAVIAEKQAALKAQQQSDYIKNIYGKYVDRYEYSDARYCIIVPRSAADIVEEGKNQHHCVAGYADRHIAGKLAILFMRDKSNPEKALYTIEMHGDRLIQIRGCHNSNPTADAMKFVNKWIKWVSLPESKKHPKQKQKKSA